MRRRRLWLAGGLVCGLLGCSSLGQRAPDSRFPVAPPPPRQTQNSTLPSSYSQTPRKPKDEPSPVLLAKPSSCVSIADFYAQCAADENRNEGERQKFAHEARKTYRRALQQDPKYLPAFLGLGRLAESLDEREEAIAVYNEALTHHPKEATIWFERGVCLSRMKRYDDALASYQRAAQIDGKNKSYTISAAYMLAMMNRHDEALSLLKRSMPEATARYHLALALKKQGNNAMARQQLALALKADPEHKPTLELIARWDESGPRGNDEAIQQTKHATPNATILPQPDQVPVVIVKPNAATSETATAAKLPTRQTRADEKNDVSWNKASSGAEAAKADEKPAMPLIPVLSEYWDRKSSAPPALDGPSPKPKPVAKLGFEEQ